MQDYSIAKVIWIDDSIQVSLINIAENIKYTDKRIIPKAQVDEMNRYKNVFDAEKRLLARSFLYESLYECYGVRDFELQYNEYRKPFLKAYASIHFSISYSRQYVLVGISRNRKLGIDIEFMDAEIDIAELAPAVMCQAELEQFNSYAHSSSFQIEYFFKSFSAKESIVKSFGTGLHFDLKDINTLQSRQHIYKGSKFVYHELGLWSDHYALAICCEQ